MCGALVGTLSNKKEFPTTTSSSEVADHREHTPSYGTGGGPWLLWMPTPSLHRCNEPGQDSAVLVRNSRKASFLPAAPPRRRRTRAGGYQNSPPCHPNALGWSADDQIALACGDVVRILDAESYAAS